MLHFTTPCNPITGLSGLELARKKKKKLCVVVWVILGYVAGTEITFINILSCRFLIPNCVNPLNDFGDKTSGLVAPLRLLY
jgi:hypothetical protein